jgi:hypothetical protein
MMEMKDRWLILAMQVLIVFMNGCVYSVFAPLADIFMEVYRISTSRSMM